MAKLFLINGLKGNPGMRVDAPDQVPDQVEVISFV